MVHTDIDGRMGEMRFARTIVVALLVCLTGATAARAQGVIEYYETDAIGSVRAVTDAAGAVIARHDYFPFGEEFAPPAPSGAPVRFAGKERDAETGLDYFGARYHSSRLGRFTTVDPVTPIEGALLDPQRCNRYSYVMNRPLVLTDPDGRCPSCVFEYLEELASSPAAEQAEEVIMARGAAAAASVAWLFSPPGRQAVSDVASQAGAMITTAAHGIGRLYQESRRPNGFSTGTKKALDEENAAAHGGVNVCVGCGVVVVPGQQHKKGVPPPVNERQRDHIIPVAKGGTGDKSNGQILCWKCNNEKSDTKPVEKE